MYSTASAQATLKPRRRWLQFSLRTMLLVMVPVACVAAWVGNEIAKGKRRAAAIAWIEEQEGRIHYAQGPPPWQQRWLGEWYPAEVTHVDFYAAHLKSLEMLTPLAEIEALELELASDGRLDLSPLTRLKKLRFLNLTNVEVEPESLEVLEQALPELYVWRTPEKLREDQPYTFTDGSKLKPAGGEWVAREDGGKRLVFDLTNLLILPVEDGVIVQTWDRLVRFTNAREEVWSVPLGHTLMWGGATFVELPAGDLVVYRYECQANSGGDAIRIDPATGEVRWQATCAPVGLPNGVPCHRDFLVLHGDTLMVVCDGALGHYVELLDVDAGLQLGRWDFSR